MKVKVEVTQKDIDRGVRGSTVECPVALALRRALGPKCSVQVGSRNVFVILKRSRVPFTGITPHDVEAFMKAFDRGKPVDPFEFEVDLWRSNGMMLYSTNYSTSTADKNLTYTVAYAV